MSAGTISIQNNAAAVTGAGTAFTTELSAGDFIVITTGGVTYTLPVKSVESDTALTLARNYNGPAVTAGAWTAMPRDTLNRISAQTAADASYLVRQRVLEVDNWYQLLEVNGDVTIKMADGSSYTGPSWKLLSEQLKKADFTTLGLGINQPVTSNFDWQTITMLAGKSWLLDASNMVNGPNGLPSTGRLIVNVAGMSSAYAMLDIYEQVLTTGTGRRWYIYVGNYGSAGSRTFSVIDIMTSRNPTPISSGGTGATTVAGARNALELGTAATVNIGTGTNQVPDMNSFALTPGGGGASFRRLPGGDILQMGRIQTSGTNTLTGTLNIPFPNANYNIIAVAQDQQASITCAPLTGNTFVISAWGVGSAGGLGSRVATLASWFAWGN